MELRGLCIANKVYGGSFIENNDKVTFLESKFIKSKTPKNLMKTTEKIVDINLDHFDYPIFDPELVDMIISKDINKKLPIPKVVKGNLKITFLDQIEEENEEEEKEMNHMEKSAKTPFVLDDKIRIFNFKNIDSKSSENVKKFSKSENVTPRMNRNFRSNHNKLTPACE